MTATHYVQLTASLDEVRFPNLCVACGDTPPAGDVPLEKMFRRTYSDSPTTYVYERVQVPLCGACLAAHQRAQPPIDPAILRRLRRTWALKVLPYVFPMGVIAWLLLQIAPKTAEAVIGLLRTPRDWGGLLLIAIVLFFLFCFYGFLRMSLDAGRPLVHEYGGGHPNDTYIRTQPGLLGSWYVVGGPPTPTLATVDFADEQFEIFAPNRRTFSFAHPDVAQRFAEVNAEQVWDPNSPRARRAARRDKVLVVAVVAVALAIALVELVRG